MLLSGNGEEVSSCFPSLRSLGPLGLCGCTPCTDLGTPGCLWLGCSGNSSLEVAPASLDTPGGEGPDPGLGPAFGLWHMGDVFLLSPWTEKSLSVLNLSHAGLIKNFQPKLPSCSQDPCLQNMLVFLEGGVQSWCLAASP